MINYVLTAVFVVELVLKMAGLGCRAYLHEAMNVFDAFIVVVSIVELAAAPPAFLIDAGVRGLSVAGSGGAGATSALRAVRVLRLFKLARNWHDLQVLLTTMAKVRLFVRTRALLRVLSDRLVCALRALDRLRPPDVRPATDRPAASPRVHDGPLFSRCVPLRTLWCS